MNFPFFAAAFLVMFSALAPAARLPRLAVPCFPLITTGV